MKKAAVSILIFVFLGNLSLFSQDGEEIDFLEKVSEPKKKTVGKKSSNSGSSNGSKISKKKEKRKFKKKKSKKFSTVPTNPENSKKNTEPDNNEGNSSGNNTSNGSQNNGSNSSNTSNSNTQTKESGNVDGQSLESASKTGLGELPKPYWVNEEMKVRPNNLPGYTSSVESETSEQGASFRSSLSEILKLGEDKKKEEEKKKVQGGQKSGSFTGFLSEYKKPIIIVVFILLFALYRLKAGKSRGNSSRRSPVTINKMRRD
ncbi:SRP-less Sec system protein [Leptospira alexanderi]|uniref:Sec region non-globular protein n=1 Tax=Leptospira alexanderi serovar Manhao 3 str. L 60 TaxID=1049759 RepID=V6I2Y8_9LEPT|nr:SRP-less Sec system protein [Leptospira alexanderi]EQA63887.1 Sec region non-globular protein [Leptospira alexanderi serovar Manhao 3 str. L 60]